MSRWRRAAYAGVVLLVIVCAAAAAGAGYVITHDTRQRRADARIPTPPPTPSVLRAMTDAPAASPTTPAPVPRADGVAAELGDLVTAPAFGGRLRAQVIDAHSGTVLYSRGAHAPAAPASTAKLLTAVAALRALGPSHTFATRVVAGASGTVYLVGGGDPTLSAAPGGEPAAYPDAARVGALAAQLRDAHVDVRRIVVDDHLFADPSVSPAWAPEDVPSSYASPITALMVDGGRDAPHARLRSDAPALAAGHALASALGHPALPVSRGTAPAGAKQLAAVASAPLRELIDEMLADSDNVIAEVLARHVAIAAHRPATFAGAAAAIRSQLAALGVEVGHGMVDASGLAASDRLSAATVAAVLRLIVGGEHPVLRELVTALPVAGWSGTLRDRYLSGSGASPAAGQVRAKTGTLTGVSGLAGLVHDRDGRLLVFALLAEHVPAGEAGTAAAERALDRIAAALAGCGCR